MFASSLTSDVLHASAKEGDNMTTYDTVMLVLAIVGIIVTLVGIKRK